MEQKEKLFLQLLRNKFDFYIDKLWDELIICQKNFNFDDNHDISCELTKDEMKIVKDYFGIEVKNDNN